MSTEAWASIIAGVIVNLCTLAFVAGQLYNKVKEEARLRQLLETRLASQETDLQNHDDPKRHVDRETEKELRDAVIAQIKEVSDRLSRRLDTMESRLERAVHTERTSGTAPAIETNMQNLLTAVAESQRMIVTQQAAQTDRLEKLLIDLVSEIKNKPRSRR